MVLLSPMPSPENLPLPLRLHQPEHRSHPTPVAKAAGVVALEALARPATEHFEPIELPTDRAVQASYQRAADNLSLKLPRGVDAGQLLARLQPQPQHLVRGEQGMFPYTKPQSRAQLADRFGVKPVSMESRMNVIVRKLRAGSSVASILNKSRRLLTLEQLAHLLNDNIEHTSAAEQDIVRGINGLPPYSRPLLFSELAGAYKLSQHVVGKREDSIVARLLDQPVRRSPRKAAPAAAKQPPAPLESEPIDPTDLRNFKRRDAGIYASTLLWTRDQLANGNNDVHNQLAADLQRRTVIRRGKRTHAMPDVLPIVPRDASYNPAIDPRHKDLLEQKAFNPAIESPEGRRTLIEQLCSRAQAIPADQLRAYMRVAQEGQQAIEDLVLKHTMLAVFVAHNVRLRLGKELSFAELIHAGRQGLHHAVLRYDEQLGFAFSTYAVACIKGYLLEATKAELTHRNGIKPYAWRKMRALREAEIALQSATPGKQIAPVPLEKLAAHLGWKPATVQRYRHMNNELSARLRPLSMSATFQDLEVSDIASYSQHRQTVDAETAQNALRESLAASFAAAKLTKQEQRILAGLFGLPPFGDAHTAPELASRLGLATTAVRAIETSAKHKLLGSVAAAKVLGNLLV
jgi:RNA polymerase sigma factor (sigma-70 family)